MEERVTKIHELMDELAKLTYETFPEGTTAMFTVNKDGYRDWSVVQWDQNITERAEIRRRRELYDQCRIGDEWTTDRSMVQNDYYAEKGTLLEKGA